LMYRQVSEMCERNEHRLTETFHGKVIYWVGVIPGNPSEQVLLNWIQENSTVQIFTDVDEFYINRPVHEAGRLFRGGNKSVTDKWSGNLLATQNYDCRVYPSNGSTAQLLRAQEIIKNIPASDYPKTVMVLADSTLLRPLLEMFSEERESLNITSGYPLRDTLTHRFVMAWLQLHASAQVRNGVRWFYHQQIEDLLAFPVIKNWLEGIGRWNEIHAMIVKRNLKYVSASWLEKEMETDMFSQRAFSLLFDWPDSVPTMFDRISGVLGDWQKNLEKLKLASLDREALPIYINRIKQLFTQFSEVLESSDVKSLRKFVHRHVGYSKIYLEEAKNSGLQVMGMLETRMVDFENVIVLGASEDTLPGKAGGASHIPYIHRVHFGLPTRQDSEALITYHFYRLLQRSKNVHLIYNTVSDALNGGEPSRFILQLDQELAYVNSKFNLSYHVESALVEADSQNPLEIWKTPEVIEAIKRYFNLRVSPSSINTFINSPLEFYFYYVLKIKEEDRVEESMEASTFGKAVHDTLEKIYLPFKGQKVNLSELESKLEFTDQWVLEEFLKHFSQADLERGKNLIQIELAKKYVGAFVQFDLDEMRENGPVKILEIEDVLQGFVSAGDLRLRLFGLADRIDERDGAIRIIDYKTGAVKQSELKANFGTMFNDSDKSKALQLAFYKYVYSKRENLDEARVESCIYSFRLPKQGLISLQLEDVEDGFMHSYEQHLRDIVADMLDETKPFAHKADSKYLTF
jgi:ATP-dependent helicase/nuclease subunit B